MATSSKNVVIVPNASTFAASSSGTKHIPFDVFINHCGPRDTKDNLATKIYDSLVEKGLKVFLDKDELNLGLLLPKALEEVMASASMHIAIFSEHYAGSPRCLAQLEFMVKTCKTIIPVFDHVDPSDLRWVEKRAYAEAFREHEGQGSYSPDVLKRWKEALHQVSFCMGSIINNKDEKEQRAVEKVLNRVMKELNKVPLEVAKHPVGLNEAVQEFDNMIAIQSADSVRIVGIWGMGGSGKTTLVKEIFNRRSSALDCSSFLSDVRDADGKVLLEKQKTLLNDLGAKSECFDNLETGKQILKNRLSKYLSVLIVLDDIDHKDQLAALLPLKESLGDKSLIIVTTRDKEVLEQSGVSVIYPMKPLNSTHAKQLFCWHAFLQNSPPSELEDLVEMFSNACHGLPLSLEVLGRQLYGRSDKEYWQLKFSEFSQMLHEDIKKRLKISYDALQKQDQQMFLDAACLFIRRRKSAAIAAWDAEKSWGGLLGWETLYNKCLVEEDEEGLIKMHDHMINMGRDIANGQSPHRLWSLKQVIEIPPQQEAIRVRGMANEVAVNCYQRQGKIIINTSEGERSFVASSQFGLKFFLGNGGFINQEHREISRELVWFRCTDFDHKNVPSWLPLKNLRILELVNAGSLEYMWESDAEAPLQLRELVIKESERLIGLPQEFCHLQLLKHLEIEGARNITSLPRNFGKLSNLKHINLNGWKKLKELPNSFKMLTLLEYLSLHGCSELTIKSEFHFLENMSNLRYLNLEGCMKLEELRLPQAASLTELYLTGTSLKELPADILQLTRITKLQIGSKFLTALPSSFGNLPSLNELKIKGCDNLETLPTSFGNLSSLTKLEFYECPNLKILPISFENLSTSTKLEIYECPNLKILPTSIENLSST